VLSPLLLLVLVLVLVVGVALGDQHAFYGQAIV
jgi:hypothetical protein